MKYMKDKKKLAMIIAVVVLTILTLVFDGVYLVQFYTMVGVDRIISAMAALKYYIIGCMALGTLDCVAAVAYYYITKEESI